MAGRRKNRIPISPYINGEVYGTLRPNDPPFTELPPYAPNSPAAKNIHPNNLITHVKDRAGHDRRYAINAKK